MNVSAEAIRWPPIQCRVSTSTPAMAMVCAAMETSFVDRRKIVWSLTDYWAPRVRTQDWVLSSLLLATLGGGGRTRLHGLDQQTKVVRGLGALAHGQKLTDVALLGIELGK